MNYSINPFQELYVTDSADARVFVELFSDFPVKSAPALFQPGNVILKGTQGAGKSMLLNLLRPQIRMAYFRASAPFPVPKELSRFIGAGINLTRSAALDIGQRPLSDEPESDEALFPLYFADFLNYFIVRDVLESIDLVAKEPDAFDALVNCDALDSFASRLSREDCWFGALSKCDSFASLCAGIDRRISSYRSFHQFNSDLSADIEATKTNIGEPIARTAECLKTHGVLPQDAAVFIRIDQIERLYRSDVLRRNLGAQYRRVINKAIGLRDSRISYRVGTRPYAWLDDLTVFGTQYSLEHLRDFRIIDLDEMLRRKENTKTWIFPEFAEDVFRRRLTYSKYDEREGTDLIRQVFGATSPPEVAIRQYAQLSSADRVLKFDGAWSSEWKAYLGRLYEEDPLSAVLASAWVRQTGSSPRRKRVRGQLPPPVGEEPWNKPYWKKERTRQALLQVAARTAQRLKWNGKEHVLALSGGNISVFVSICYEVWEAFLRSERRLPERDRRDPVRQGIDLDVQAVGVQTAAVYWYQKIAEQPKGDDRQRFINVLGRLFRTWLVNDMAMSYPGYNGFSLAKDDLEGESMVNRFLADAVDYGDLHDAPHTTKNKDRKQRTKWYLNPILSAYFQVPETHVKEPYYSTLSDVTDWLKQAGVILGPRQRSSLGRDPTKRQVEDSPTLFDSFDEQHING